MRFQKLNKFDKIFVAEITQDIPLWLSLIMGLYPKLQNEIVYFLSLIIGSIASIYIIKMIKDGEYSPGLIAENSSEAFAFSIYSIALIIILIIASYKKVLYMETFMWSYLIVFSLFELIFFIKNKNTD
ncbi:hypothetical protein [Hydrogenothermus marinus]|uniref:Uncharacterized protein n=1 Tax=Hydrogenothermus marinus TaxID=133270 RepID=A0A3M0BTG9_9AQUI|nr:hypothetical protein [Hydrogenothermus marinus]RMA97835.1 hypothetical protein CLV39_0464 [Hydrogenothermus marinus]